MKFPTFLTAEEVKWYEEIFDSGDGERLLMTWDRNFDPADSIGHPLGIRTFKSSIKYDQLEFSMACLRVLPDRFFDLSTPLTCRDLGEPHVAIYDRLADHRDAPELAARYHPLLELMAKRGWSFTRPLEAGADRKEEPVLHRLAEIPGTTPLLRRLLPLLGGAEAVRACSDSMFGGWAGTIRLTTLLHQAVSACDVDLVRFLVTEVGIDVNTTDHRGRTALMRHLWILPAMEGSAWSGATPTEQNRAVARELLRLGLNLEHRNADAATAAIMALELDKPEALEVLLELGADAQVRDGRGRGLLQIAEEGGNEAAARFLRSLQTRELLLGAMPDDDNAPAARGRPSGGLTL